MLHRRRVECVTDALQHRIALVAQIAEYAHLDQFVGEHIDVELVQHGGCESMMTDADDRMQVVRLGAKRPAPGRG